jgi:hypothetical protein
MLYNSLDLFLTRNHCGQYTHEFLFNLYMEEFP